MTPVPGAAEKPAGNFYLPSMKRFQHGGPLMVPVLLLAGAMSCATAPRLSSRSSADVEAFAPPTALIATLATPVDIDLHWKNRATSPGCYFVEFAFEQHPGNDDFTMLDALWPETTRFRHDKVAPETHFVYRIRPLFGQPSPVAEVTMDPAALPKASAVPRVKGDTLSLPSLEMEGPLDLVREKDSAPRCSIRTMRTAVQGAPVRLAALPVFTNAIDLHWEDRAADEDGYLVDISVNPTNDFRVCALLPPDTTSFRKTGLPAGLKYYFRVRAFFYGKPSDPVELVSGREPVGDTLSTAASPNAGAPMITVEKSKEAP